MCFFAVFHAKMAQKAVDICAIYQYFTLHSDLTMKTRHMADRYYFFTTYWTVFNSFFRFLIVLVAFSGDFQSFAAIAELYTGVNKLNHMESFSNSRSRSFELNLTRAPQLENKIKLGVLNSIFRELLKLDSEY